MTLIKGIFIDVYADLCDFYLESSDAYESLLGTKDIQKLKVHIQDDKIVTVICMNQNVKTDEASRAYDSVGTDLLYGKLIIVNTDENGKVYSLSNEDIDAVESSLMGYGEDITEDEDGDPDRSILICELVE